MPTSAHHRPLVGVLALLSGSLILASCSSAAAPAASVSSLPSASAAANASASGAAAAAQPSASAGSSGAASAAPSAGTSGQLGMIFEVNNAGWQQLLGSSQQKGMVVALLLPNQPGAKAGMKEGDVVSKMNGVATTNANVANQQIRKLKPGDKLAMEVQRTGGPANVDVTVEPTAPLDLPGLLNGMVTQDAKNARGWFLRGAYSDTSAAAAVADYTQAIQLEPKFVSAYVERGTVQQASNPTQALADFNKAASLDPTYEPLYVNRSVLYSSQKTYDKALADDQQAAQLDPSDPAAYANLGIGYINSGKANEAMTAEDKALQLDPQFGPALLYRGLLQRDASRTDLQSAVTFLSDPSLRTVAQNALDAKL